MPAARGARERAGGWWQDAYIDGYVPAVAAATPDRVAVVDGPVALTYAETERSVRAVAAGLQGLGVVPGEVVSWQLPNWHEAFLLHQAILRIGAVSNPIVPIYRQREVEYILAEARASVVIVPETFRGFAHLAMIEEMRPALPDLKHVVAVRPGTARRLTFDLLLSTSDAPVAVSRTADDPMLLLFTSGTTARPKGVVHTHNTLDYENRSMIEVLGLTGSDVVFMPSPVSHITGLLYGLQLPPMLGTTVVFQDVWDPVVALGLIEQHRCSFSVAATPFLHGLTYHPRLAEFDLSSLRVLACGGADVPAGLIRDARLRLDCVTSRVYGSSEFPTLCVTGPDQPPEKGASTDGFPIGAAVFRVVDEAEGELGPDTTGELVVSGPEQFLGYLRPDDDACAFTPDGWFRTGDLASYDADGYVTIQGRKKDIVLRGGENISVAEIESLLFDHPAVAEVAIVAMPDPVMVERACAYVVPAPGRSLTLPDLVVYLDGFHIAKQKVPERLELVDELPKTSSGKVQKFRLREMIRVRLAEEPPVATR